jgi:hypothetical protein
MRWDARTLSIIAKLTYYEMMQAMNTRLAGLLALMRELRSWLLILVGFAAVGWMLLWAAGVFHPKVHPSGGHGPLAIPSGAVLETLKPVAIPRYETAVGTIQAVHEAAVASKILARIEEVNVTAGQKVADVARDWFAANRYQDYLYLHGLGVEIAESLAEFIHKRIRSELGFGHEDDRDVKKLLKQGYRGSRYSFGYPAVPRLEDQKLLLELLGADRIGIELSEEFQLHPEQSTSAIVVHHPQAKYFNI